MAPTAAYSFTLPSIADDTTLDCRVYHPQDLEDRIHDAEQRMKGAIVAHPYAPLGGSYDDPVVLAVTQILLEQGLVVVTFNFRGAGGSQGNGSWSGRGEIEDYVSAVGFLVWYLQFLNEGGESGYDAGADPDQTLEVLLAGYSYGALVLARTPELGVIADRFQDAALGTAAAEIILRAKMLSKQTLQALEELANGSRGRSSKAAEAIPESPRPKPSPVTVGGEETPPSDRRRSRDSRRSSRTELVRRSVEVPSRIKQHLRRHSDEKAMKARPQSARPQTANAGAKPGLRVTARYLVISPVLLPIPFTTILAPLGVPSLALGHRRTASENGAGMAFTRHPTLVMFGTKDTFTSDKQLRAWAEKLQRESKVNDFRWKQIQNAGHFWRENSALRRMQEIIGSWVRLQGCRAPHVGFSG